MTHTDESPSFLRQRRTMLAAACIGMAASYSPVAISSFGFFIVPLSKAFGWGRGDISLAVTILSYTVALLSPFVGGLIDRLGVRRVLLPAILVFGLTFLGLAAMSGQLWLFFLLYFLLALSGAGTTPASYSQLIVRWYDDKRGMALGIGLSGVGLGLIVMPPAIQQLIEHFGWRGGYLGLSAVVLLIALPVCLVGLRERSGAPAAEAAERQAPAPGKPGLTLGVAARTRSFWLMGFSFLLLGVFTTGFASHLVPMLSDRGISGGMIGVAVSIKGATIIAGRLATGWLFDRLPPQPVVALSLIGPVLCLVMLFLGVTGPWVFVAVALAGFGIGAELDFMSYLTSRYFGVLHYARIYGVLYAMLIVGSGTGPLIMGYCQQLTGDYQVGLVVLTIVTIVAIIPFMLLGKYPIWSAEPDAADFRSH